MVEFGGRARRAAGIALALGATHCGPGEPPRSEEVAIAASAIADGYEDTEDVAVVAVLNESMGSLCSGSLLARNLVLTARHCVSSSNTGSGVLCSSASFAPPAPATSFSVTTDPVVVLGEGGFPVTEVLVLEDDGFCGGDVAMLVLAEPIPESVTAPLIPRLDDPIEAGEAYYAVGYGGIDDDGADAGVRRRRDDLAVACVGNACEPDEETPEVRATEFLGETGICIGDSGGPAIDLEDRVFGITSRGTIGCDMPVYGSTVAQAAFVRDAAMFAAGVGEYEPPVWAEGASLDPHLSAPVGEACAEAADCYTGLCVGAAGGTYCSRPCDDAHECPSGYACGADGVCGEPPPPKHTFPVDDDDGCAVARVGAHPRDGRSFAFLGVALAIAVAARRRRPR